MAEESVSERSDLPPRGVFLSTGLLFRLFSDGDGAARFRALLFGAVKEVLEAVKEVLEAVNEVFDAGLFEEVKDVSEADLETLFRASLEMLLGAGLVGFSCSLGAGLVGFSFSLGAALVGFSFSLLPASLAPFTSFLPLTGASCSCEPGANSLPVLEIVQT